MKSYITHVVLTLVACCGLSVASVPAWAVPVTSGLQLHLDASTLGLNDGDDVTLWADQSGNGRDADTLVGSIAPTYTSHGVGGKPAVQFVSGEGALGSSLFSTTFGMTNELTMFIAFASNSSSQGTFISLDSDDGGVNRVFSYNNRFSAGDLFSSFDGSSGDNNSSQRYEPVAFDDGNPHVYTVYTDGSTITQQADLFAPESHTDTPDTSDDLDQYLLGSLSGGSSQELNGNIAEILIYNRQLEAAEIAAVQGFLNAKYGIVPEPATAGLIGLGLFGLAVGRRRRR